MNIANETNMEDVRKALLQHRAKMNAISPDDARKIIASKRKFLRKTNRDYPKELVNVPEDKWPKDFPWPSEDTRTAVLRSREFLVQIFQTPDPNVSRMSVNRTEIDSHGRFVDGITWEDLMRLKREAGNGERFAVEVFPSDADLVNVANMRHLFVFSEPPSYAWRRKK
jgi:hypothetical protein